LVKYPTLGKGTVGVVSYRHMNSLFRNAEAAEEFFLEWMPILERKREKHFDQFWAEIQGDNLEPTTNKWRYAWQEVRLTDDAWATFTGARSGTTTTDYALNTCEAGNNGSGVEAPGIDVSANDYPSGFSMQRIRGKPVVLMRAFRDTTGAVRYAFTMENDHDGTCS
jgi:hypothetical protein